MCKTMMIANRALGYLSEVENGSLLLKTHLRYRIDLRYRLIRAGSDQKASLLWSSFHGSRKYCESCQEKEAIKQFYPAATPGNHGNYQQGNISIKMHYVTFTKLVATYS